MDNFGALQFLANYNFKCFFLHKIECMHRSNISLKQMFKIDNTQQPSHIRILQHGINFIRQVLVH